MPDASIDLAELRRVAEEVAREWGVTLGEPYALSRYSYVAPAGDGAVLKIAWDGDDESLHEGEAMELWDGDGAPRLLRHESARRALLMEQAVPGDDASTLPEDEAVAVAVDLGPRLWRPAGPPFRSVHEFVPRWLDNAERRGEEGSELAPLAREIYAELGTRADSLVHGDFHHHNILRHGDRWLAIDSKAMLAEPEYELWSFLNNPLPYTMTLEDAERRLAAFESVGLDQRRMRAWTVVRAAFLGADEAEVAVVRELWARAGS
jgi:streptomycin 6-kinase